MSRHRGDMKREVDNALSAIEAGIMVGVTLALMLAYALWVILTVLGAIAG